MNTDQKTAARQGRAPRRAAPESPPNPSPRPKPITARERNRRRMHNDIYEAAMSLFDERGYSEVTVDEICEQAGISKATFFRYFENKYGLVDEFNQRIAAKIDAAVDLEAMTAADCIRRATDTMYEEWLHSAPQLRTLAREFVRAGVHLDENAADPMARGLVSTLMTIVETGQNRGEFDTRFDPVQVAPLIVFAWTLATISWFDRHDHAAFRASIHNLVELHIIGLAKQETV